MLRLYRRSLPPGPEGTPVCSLSFEPKASPRRPWASCAKSPGTMWLFRRSQQRTLLEQLLRLEERRLEHRSALESKRDELEIRKLEIELAHIEARTKAQIEVDKAKAELREKRRAISRRAALKRWGKLPEEQGASCPLCINPMFSKPTVEMIRAHQLHEGVAQASESIPEPSPRGN